MEATIRYGGVAVSHREVAGGKASRKYDSYFWLQVAGIVAALALGAAALAWALVVIVMFGGMALDLLEFVVGNFIV